MPPKSSNTAPDQSLSFTLHDVARLMRRNFNRRVQALGLTQAQWQVLAYLNRCEGITQAKLADILEVQPISVARLIDRMEAAGWVERRRDASDRRAFNLYLAPKAEPMVKTMQDAARTMRAQALSGLSETEQQQMLENLLVMRKNLTEDTM